MQKLDLGLILTRNKFAMTCHSELQYLVNRFVHKNSKKLHVLHVIIVYIIICILSTTIGYTAFHSCFHNRRCGFQFASLAHSLNARKDFGLQCSKGMTSVNKNWLPRLEDIFRRNQLSALGISK